MISMIRKVAPGLLARAILALAGGSGKNTSQRFEPDYFSEHQAPLPRRTTITVQTETLLIVRSERTTSSSSCEAGDVLRDSLITTRATTLITTLKHWL
jgi:hypothetical protein